MMGQMSLYDWVEKSEKKNDQNQVDGMKQEVYSKSNMHNEISDLWFLKKMRMVERGFQKIKNEYQYKATQQRSNFGDSQVQQ